MKTTIKTADGKELPAVQLEKKQVTNAVGETVTITRSFVPMPAEMQAALNSLPEDERHEAMMQYMVDQGAIDADVAELYDLDPVPEVFNLQGDRSLTRQDTFDVQEICSGLRHKSNRNRRRAIEKAHQKLQKKGRLK